MLDREGYEGPADAAIIGDEDAVAERIASIAALGVEELCASVFACTAEDDARTRKLLALWRSSALLADPSTGRSPCGPLRTKGPTRGGPVGPFFRRYSDRQALVSARRRGEWLTRGR